MSKHIYVAALYNERANLLKVSIKKETPKMFVFNQDAPIERIVGHDVPVYLFSKQMRKQDFFWYRTAEDALKRLRNLAKENMQAKKLVLRKAESELGYVERFKLTAEEQENDSA